MNATACVWTSEHTLWSWFSSYTLTRFLEINRKSLSFRGKCRYPRSHLTGPLSFLSLLIQSSNESFWSSYGCQSSRWGLVVSDGDEQGHSSQFRLPANHSIRGGVEVDKDHRWKVFLKGCLDWICHYFQNNTKDGYFHSICIVWELYIMERQFQVSRRTCLGSRPRLCHFV